MISGPRGDRCGRPGTWWPCDERDSAYWSCTVCGRANSLHCYTIDDETGAVSPRVSCEACGHREAVCLEGWRG